MKEITTGREYLRVSQDRSGRARSVEEQHADNQRAAGDRGFTVNGDPYSDVSLSASRFATKPRGGFARLLADLEHGTFGADALVLWESSRGSRRVGEWATLLDKLEDARVQVLVTTHNRVYDPANWRDRKTLLEDAVDNEADSAKKSDAILRAAAATAARGEPHGRIPYGYTRSYDPKTRKLISQDPHPAEAAVVRELVTRLHKGHSLHGIAADFAARGITTRTGKPFAPEHLRDMALSPVYAGLRVHEPGNRNGRYLGSLDGAVEATWPALVDRTVWLSVRSMLLSPQRKTTRPGRAVHLLSLIAVCGVCGGPMAGTMRRGYREYECHRASHVRVLADDLDRYAETVMFAYLSQDDVIERLRAGAPNPELDQVRADLAAARAELASLRSLAARPPGDPQRVSAVAFAGIEPGLIGGIAKLEARERELTTPPELAGIIEPGADVAARWKAAPMPARRKVARLLCQPRILGTLAVGRAPSRGHRGDVAARVEWRRD